MRSSPYFEIFGEMLKCNLIERPVSSLIHEKEGLAALNATIRSKLIEKGIDPENVLTYRKVFKFIYESQGSNAANKKIILESLYHYSLKLKDEIKQLSRFLEGNKVAPQIKAIAKHIATIETAVQKIQYQFYRSITIC